MGKAASVLRSQEEALASARAFVREVEEICARRGLRLAAAFLVGSRARGDYRADSDVDVVLVVEGVEGLDALERLRLFSEALLRVKWDVDYRVFTPDEWERGETVWIRELKREAIRLA